MSIWTKLKAFFKEEQRLANLYFKKITNEQE